MTLRIGFRIPLKYNYKSIIILQYHITPNERYFGTDSTEHINCVKYQNPGNLSNGGYSASLRMKRLGQNFIRN